MSIPVFERQTALEDHTHVRLPRLLELPSGIVVPASLHSSVFGTSGNITTIDPDDAVAAGASGLVADAAHQHAFTSAAASSLAKTSTNTEGSASTHARSDHGHATNALPWGVVAQFVSTSGNGPHSADTATDMVCNNVSVISGHLYSLHFHSNVLIGAGAGVWSITVRANGTDIGRYAANLVTGTSQDRDGLVYWTASATQSTDDFDVFADETTDGSTFALQASSAAPRWFTITDLGPAP